jgi:CRP/FNR family transcriptional regulator
MAGCIEFHGRTAYNTQENEAVLFAGVAMSIHLEQIRAISYFRDLEPRAVERIRSSAFEVKLEKGQMLFIEGEPAQAMYVVLSGQVKIFKLSPDGREQVLRVAGAGDCFNEVPVFDEGPNPANAQALEQTVVWGLRRPDIRRLAEEHPAIALGFLSEFAKKLRFFTRKVEDLSFRSVTARVAKLLLEMAEDDGRGGLRLARQLTQQEMAALVGTAREMIGRAFKALEKEGAIRLERHRVVINSRAALARML